MQITNQTPTVDIVNHLKGICETHDWYFQMSDDSQAYESGLVVASEINYLKSVLVARGFKAQVETLIAQYAPKQPSSMQDLLKPHPGHKGVPSDVRRIMDTYKSAGCPGFPESEDYVDLLVEKLYTVEQALGFLEKAIGELDAEEA